MSKKSESGSSRNRFSLSSIFGGGQRGAVASRSTQDDFTLDQASLQELKNGKLADRLKLLKTLVEKVEERRLEKSVIESLWLAIKDIAEQGQMDARHRVIGFLNALVSSHYDQLGPMRQTLFSYIKLCRPEDVEPCFALLTSLTQNGTYLHMLEEHISEYLLNLLPVMIERKKMVEILKFISDFTKTNATYADQHLLTSIIEQCFDVRNRQSSDEIHECINYIEVVVQYAIMPPDCISTVLLYICTVRHDMPISQPLHNVMTMILSLKCMEHTSVYILCSFLERPPLTSFVGPGKVQLSAMGLLSGSLWNCGRAKSEEHHCTAILGAVSCAIRGSPRDALSGEVLTGIQLYLENHSDKIEHVSWEVFLDVLVIIVQQLKEKGFRNEEVVRQLNAVLDLAEGLYSAGLHTLSDRFYDVIEACIDIRPKSSFRFLMDRKERLIVPGVLNWLENLAQFMADFHHVGRPEWMRRNALEQCRGVVEQFYELYEEEMIEQIILPIMKTTHLDPHPNVRHRAVQFLLWLCYRCRTGRFYNIVNIILKVVSVVVQQKDENESILLCDELINLFINKVPKTPSRHALFLFEGLVKLATGFYSTAFKPHFAATAKIRQRILECLWRISMSSSGEMMVYLPPDSQSTRSIICPFLRVNVADVCLRPQEVSPAKLELEVPEGEDDEFAISYLPYNHVEHLLYHCLSKEEDWKVLEATLSVMKKRFCNANFQTMTSVDTVTSQLIALLEDTKRLEELRHSQKDFSISDVKIKIYPVLVRLIPYQAELYKQCGSCEGARKILKALINGLTARNAKICIEGLVIATLEMGPLVKPRFISNIIHNIAKIAAGRFLAIATLSFLSAVSLNPSLYRDFTEEEYKVVISVILPYMDPVKFDVFVIHFAHVVVCNWYVRCHYKHRPAFKDYILSQLRSAVRSAERKPRADSCYFEGGSKERRRVSTEANAKDRGLRPKSGEYQSRLTASSTGASSASANSRGNFRKVPSSDSINKQAEDGKMAAHHALIDVTEDLLERWMFSGRCNLIKRSAQIELLFSQGKTKTWVVRNTLVTITTTLSCGAESECERCSMIQALVGEKSFTASPETSAEYGRGAVPIPGGSGGGSVESISKVFTPACGCWCKDYAHLEVRTPTSNSSMVIRLQNKCHFVNMDARTGGDCHQITSLFDDDLTQLLIRDIRSDYSDGRLEQLAGSLNKQGSLPHRKRRLSTPQADEMTPTTGIEVQVRQRSHSDLGVSDTIRETSCGSLEEPKSAMNVNICQRFGDKESAVALGESSTSGLGRKPSIFKYAKQNGVSSNTTSMTGGGSEADETSRDSATSSPLSSPRYPGNSRTSSTAEINGSKYSVGGEGDGGHHDIDPSFIFRQIYPLVTQTTETMPVLMPDTEDLSRSLRALDRILVANTHKIGVLYVGSGQTTEVKILRNTYGSKRYVDFVKGLGDMIWLSRCDQKTVYVGGLDTSGYDGDYAVSWRDKTTQVIFHVATLMPQDDTDPTSTNKKRHIGNNIVTIVYNDSGLPYRQGTIKGQCNLCDVIIEPQPNSMNLVSLSSLKTTKLTDLKPHSALLVSNSSLPGIVRQMAVNANHLCQVSNGLNTGSVPYNCNWLERLKKIQKILSRSVTPMSSPTPARRETFF